MFTVPRLCALFAVLALSSLPMLAQDVGEEEPEVTVVVTADRIEGPQSESIATATVITGEEMRRQGAETVADALKLVPGVAIKQNGQFGALAVPAIRGTSGNQTLVLVDGMRVSNSSFMGGADLSKFPVEEIERVEIIRGPASSLYGSEAIGGVINVITRRPEGSGGSSMIGYGSKGRRTRNLSLYGALPQMAWQLTSSLPEYDGTRPNSDFSATNLAGRLDFPAVAGWRMTLRAEHYRDDLGLPGADTGNTGFADLDDRQEWDRNEYDLSASRELGGGELAWRAYLVRQVLDNLSPGTDWMTGNPAVFRSLVTGKTKVGEMTYSGRYGAHRALIGLEYRAESYENAETQDGAATSSQDQDVTTRALFAQDRWRLTPATDLVLGLRFDDHSVAGSRLAPRVGVNTAVRPDLNLRASYGEGFRSPALVEMYYNAMGFTGNPNLRPEVSQQYEVGLNWQGARSSVDLALFRNSVYNEIQWAGITFNNVARTRHRGVELAWTRKLAGKTALSATYSYLDSANRDSGARLLRLPHNQATLTLSTQFREYGCAL
ncbi:MAG TPA: TonB-dependent receptor, partial [Armatimonadota bacterium]|nr:TonB-dependent receptor [Armatimonadota bacterium]